MSHAQQILESRNIFRLNVVELQCNQVDDWLGVPPEIPVIFGAYVYRCEGSTYARIYSWGPKCLVKISKTHCRFADDFRARMNYTAQMKLHKLNKSSNSH